MVKKLLEWIRNNREITAILALGAALRLFPLARESFWYDEALTALSLKLPLLEMVRERLAAGHSPFYFLLVYPFARLFGTGEFAVRLPSAIASIVSIYIFYLIALKLFSDRKISLASTLLFALSALNIYFAQEARMYAICVLFVILSFYYLLRAMEEDDVSLWLYYCAFAGASVYLSAVAVPVVIAQGAYVVFKRKKVGHFIISASFVAAMYLPMALLYSKMKRLGFIEWLPPITLATFLEIFYGFGLKPVPVQGAQGIYSFYVNIMQFLSIYFIVGLILFGALSSIYAAIKKRKLIKDADTAVLLLIWLVIPIILELLYTIFKQPMLGPKRYVIILSPAYYLLIGLGLSRISARTIKKALLVTLTVLFSAALLNFYLSPTREDWRGAITYINAHSKPGEVLFGDFSTHTMIRYYGNNKGLMLVETGYFNNLTFPERWILLREREFSGIFRGDAGLKRDFKTEEIKGYNGLKLYRLHYGKGGK